jgi:predicted N-acyltransferase
MVMPGYTIAHQCLPVSGYRTDLNGVADISLLHTVTASPHPSTAAAAAALADEMGVSSLHVTFPTGEEWAALGALGFQQRKGIQFHWCVCFFCV